MSERAMEGGHSKRTIISMAVLAAAATALLHEGVGHGVVAWLRGDVPSELTSNHLDALRPDKWVEAGGTLVNLFVGAVSLVLSLDRGLCANRRYFLWIFAAFNLLTGCGYFLFSGILGLGDWAAVVAGWPNPLLVRAGMSIIGAALYVLAVRLIAVAGRPFCSNRREYNVVGRLPYLAACLFNCAAGALDPLGLKLFFLSTVPAAFGGLSGLLWADALMRRSTEEPLRVTRAPGWWMGAAILGLCYVVVVGRGIEFRH